MATPDARAEATGPSVLVDAPAEHVARIRLARPERLNAVGLGMAREIKTAVEALTPATRVLLVGAVGRAFCVGADLKERRAMDVAQRRAHNLAINEGLNAIMKTSIVTIAVVNGAAMGGGCELAMACDLRIAAEDALIGLTETRIGVIPGAGGTQRLPRLIGASRALELMLTGEPVTATRAVAIGLVNEAVPLERLEARALELATLLASRSPIGQREIKRLVREGLELPLEDGLRLEREALGRVLASADYSEGLAAFAERRKPNFVGQ